MRTKIGRWIQWGLSGAMMIALSLPVMGQSQQQQRRQQQAQDLQLEPLGWIRASYDYDNDGMVDAYEYVFAYDIERAQQQSRQRGQQQQLNVRDRQQLNQQGWVRVSIDTALDGQAERTALIHTSDLNRARQASQRRMQREGRIQDMFQPAREGQRQQDMRQQGMRQQDMRQQGMRQQGMRQQGTDQIPRQLTQLRGEITSKQNIQLMGAREQHVVVRIRTQEGRTIPVALGPVSKIQQLDLQQGDQISVTGFPGRINQRRMLLAQRIQSNGQTAQVSWPRHNPLLRLQGEVTSTQATRYRGLDQQHLEAQVRLDETGREVAVDLGPQQNIQNRNVDIQQGDRITLLGQPIRIDGERAFLARQFKVEDQNVVQVPLAEEFTQAGMRQQQLQQLQQRRQQQNR